MADDEVTQRAGPAPLLEVHDVSKHFGGVRALVRASLKLAAGTTVALAGENGAGKSTLIKVLSGAIRPDAGQVLIDGKEGKLRNPLEAAASGIATVYQELSLLPLPVRCGKPVPRAVP